MEHITNVKVGDHVICFDEYLHDYEEHELIIHHIESDPEYATNTNPLGIICFADCSAHLKMAGSTYMPSPPLIRPKPYSLQTDIDFTL